jgi:hypothetical protein
VNINAEHCRTPEFITWLDKQTLKVEKIIKSTNIALYQKKPYSRLKKTKTTPPKLRENLSIIELQKEVRANLKIYGKLFEEIYAFLEGNTPEEYYISSAPATVSLKISDVVKILDGKIRDLFVIEPNEYDYISILNKCSEAIIDNHFEYDKKQGKDLVTVNFSPWLLVSPKISARRLHLCKRLYFYEFYNFYKTF